MPAQVPKAGSPDPVAQRLEQLESRPACSSWSTRRRGRTRASTPGFGRAPHGHRPRADPPRGHRSAHGRGPAGPGRRCAERRGRARAQASAPFHGASKLPARWVDAKPLVSVVVTALVICGLLGPAAVASSPAAAANRRPAGLVPPHAPGVPTRSSPAPPAERSRHAAVRAQRHAARSGHRRRLLRPGDPGGHQGAHRQLRVLHRPDRLLVRTWYWTILFAQSHRLRGPRARRLGGPRQDPAARPAGRRGDGGRRRRASARRPRPR